MKAKPQKSMAYSARSQASWRKQWELEAELDKNEGWLRVAEDNVKRLSETKRQVAEHMARSGAVSPSYLGDICRELEDEERRLAVHKGRKASLRKQIAELQCPSCEHTAERLRRQMLIARIADERLSMDGLIGNVVAQLRALLEGRAKKTAQMARAAQQIELASDLDEVRFDKLLAALPDCLAQESEHWHRSFLGADCKREYVANKRELELDETLWRAGCAEVGERVLLTEQEAQKLLQDSRVSEL